jgi:cell division protein FtsN
MAGSKRKSVKRSSAGAPGWAWMLFGLSLGLVVAAAVYVSDRRDHAISTPQDPAPTPLSQSLPEGASEPAVRPQPPHPATRFDFYEMLPKFEVVIPELESDARPDRDASSLGEEGRYVLQAGSFTEHADADRMQANLALLGVESRIQRVTIDDDVYHRVRVGPIDDLSELNAIRRRLWDAEIEILLIKVPY